MAVQSASRGMGHTSGHYIGRNKEEISYKHKMCIRDSTHTQQIFQDVSTIFRRHIPVIKIFRKVYISLDIAL